MAKDGANHSVSQIDRCLGWDWGPLHLMNQLQFVKVSHGARFLLSLPHLRPTNNPPDAKPKVFVDYSTISPIDSHRHCHLIETGRIQPHDPHSRPYSLFRQNLASHWTAAFFADASSMAKTVAAAAEPVGAASALASSAVPSSRTARWSPL